MLFGVQPFLSPQTPGGGGPPPTYVFGSVGTSWTASATPFTNSNTPAGHTGAAQLILDDAAVDLWSFGAAYKLVTIGQIRAQNGAGTPPFPGVVPGNSPTIANLKLQQTQNTVPGGVNLTVRVRCLSSGLNTTLGIDDTLSDLTTAASPSQVIAGATNGSFVTWDVRSPIAEAASQGGWTIGHDIFFFIEVIASSSVPGIFQNWTVDLDNMELEFQA